MRMPCFAISCLMLVVVAGSACAVSDGAPFTPSPAAGLAGAPPVPLFSKLEPAPIGSALRVFADPDQLVGWIAGTTSVAGSTAKIEIAGRDHRAPIGADNMFVLPFRVDTPTEAVVTAASMTQRVTLRPRPAKGTPVAYFVVDRSAYRPGQKLGFAAFLRELDAGPAKPIANRRVEVRIIADARQTVVARLPLVSDEAGRITGEYTFSPGDPLDLYTIAIDGYPGTARVSLAEFRKPKVKLDIDAALQDRAAQLAFRALDFLDKPIPGGSVSFTAQVVRETSAEQRSELSPTGFSLGAPLGLLRHDQKLVFTAGELGAVGFASGPVVVAETKASVELDASGGGSYRVPLRSDFLRGHHRLLVDATIVDANGREQRTTRAIPIERRDVRIELATPHELVAAGEPLDVRARVLDAAGRVVRASTSITAIRVPALQDLYAGGHGAYRYWNNWNGVNGNGGNGSWNGNVPNHMVLDSEPSAGAFLRCHATGAGCRPWQLRHASRGTRYLAPATTETLAASAVVIAEHASVTLDDPGTYRLIASARLGDGSTVWSELGVAVREPAVMPALVIELDRDEVRHGERITGYVHSRYRDVAALVLVRDATGVRARRRVVLAAGMGRIDIPVGTSLGYGAAIEAYVLGADRAIASTQELFRAVPTTKRLAITTNAKQSYGPGEQVDLEIAVDHREPVDLVVSVYDQSLLGIAPDRTVDVSTFFHADQRLHERAGLATLQLELGDVTFDAVVERARAITKRKVGDQDSMASVERNEAQAIVHAFDQDNHVTVVALVSLLRFAGVQVTNVGYLSWSDPITDRKKLGKTRVAEYLAGLDRVVVHRVADTLVLADRNHIVALNPGGQGIPFIGAASGNASYSVQVPSAPPSPSPLAVGGDTTGDVIRRDFSDSALWRVTRTGRDGKARVTFRLPDSLTRWHVVVTAVARDLSVGRHTATLRTLRDVMIWPMLPRQLAEGDTLSIHGSVHNLTDTDRDIVVALRAQNVELLSPAQVTIRVPRGKNVPVTWSVRAGQPGLATLVMSATSGTVADASEKRIPIVASSADQIISASGFATAPLTAELPAGVDPKRASLEITFAPSLAADMVTTLDYLVEYPYGCAEQTMSRFAPAIRVAGVLGNLGVNDGKLAARLPEVVDGGMKRLAGLQQPDGGWAWNGHAETHEMITPYVVWGLIEAEKAGYKLPDSSTIDRGLDRLRALIQARLGTEQGLSDRTCLMYVYSQKHRLPDAWWNGLVERRDELSDYALGLALEMAVARGDRDNAARMVKVLHERVVRSDGGAYWRTGGFSRWMEDRYETTAVVLKALVAHDPSDDLVAGVIAFFVATKQDNRWNSTKATAMVLYAMTDFLGKQGVKPDGQVAHVDYALNGGAPAHLAFADGLSRKIVVDGSKLAQRTTLTFAKASPGMMARVVVRYHASGRDLKPASHGLDVERALYLLGPKGARIKQLRSGDRVLRGTYLESIVTVAHGQHQEMPYLLVEDPKPAGAEALPLDDPRFPTTPVTWVLREDRESHVAFHHERAAAQTTVRTLLHLEMNGDLTIPPAQAELMYQTQTRGHSGSFALEVD